MLEKLITDLKKSLPEALRKKMGGNQEDGEEVEPSEDENGDSALNAEEGGQPEDKKKKQMSMIIRVVVILGLGYYALDEFVLKTTEPTVEEMLAKQPKKKKRPVVKPADNAPVSADAKAENTAPAVTETPAVNTEATDTQPPIENVNVMDKNEPQVTEAPPVEETPPVVEEKPVVTAPEPKIDQSIDQLVESVDQNATNPMEVVTAPSQDQGGNKDSGSSMASKIVEEVVETAPPAYDQLGRGLVYNCKDKYWACIDKPAYVVCNKNMKWNKSKGNGAECVVQAVYNSEEDCAKIQKYNVSTNKETSFCQN